MPAEHVQNMSRKSLGCFADVPADQLLPPPEKPPSLRDASRLPDGTADPLALDLPPEKSSLLEDIAASVSRNITARADLRPPGTFQSARAFEIA